MCNFKPGDVCASSLNTALFLPWRACGSMTTMTGSPRNGIVVPSHHSTRACCNRAPRSRCSPSLRKIQFVLVRSADSMSPVPAARGTLTLRPSTPTMNPMLRRRARVSEYATRTLFSRISRSACGCRKASGASRLPTVTVSVASGGGVGRRTGVGFGFRSRLRRNLRHTRRGNQRRRCRVIEQ